MTRDCQADSVFSGISTFGRLPYQPCLNMKDVTYDIAFIGTPVPPSVGCCARDIVSDEKAACRCAL